MPELRFKERHLSGSKEGSSEDHGISCRKKFDRRRHGPEDDTHD
jgi:hypothetical protein